MTIQEAIRCGDIETALKGADDYEKYAVEGETEFYFGEKIEFQEDVTNKLSQSVSD